MKWTEDRRWLIPALLVCALMAHAADKNQDTGKDKAKQPLAQTVDTGSFGVRVKGRRVLTESFTIEQRGGNSTIKAQLKAEGENRDNQSSEMQLTGNGEILRYEWTETSPSTSSLVVAPNNEFLIEKITTPASPKPAEQPFLMPSTSPILDNNFFIHREVLLWRYLAAALCKGEGSSRQCQPQEFGVLVPQDRTSMHVRLELVGKDKVNIGGVERELLRLSLSGEGFNWSLWVDDHDQFKLMRVAIPADDTEVVRD